MKTIGRVVLALSFLLCATGLNAQSVTLTSKLKPKYVGSNGGNFYDKTDLQTDAWIEWKNGLYADIWISTGFNKQMNFDKEIDLTFGYAGKLRPFNYAVDGDYYFLQGKDVVNINTEANRRFKVSGWETSINPFLRGEWYFPTQTGGPRKGVFISAGARVNAKMFTRRIDGTLEGWVKKDSGSFGFDSTLLGQGYAGLAFILNEKTKIITGFKFHTPIFHVLDGRKTEFVPEIGLSYAIH